MLKISEREIERARAEGLTECVTDTHIIDVCFTPITKRQIIGHFCDLEERTPAGEFQSLYRFQIQPEPYMVHGIGENREDARVQAVANTVNYLREIPGIFDPRPYIPGWVRPV